MGAEQEQLQQTLESISAQEQSQIASVNALQAAALTEIRTELAIRLEALRIEQEAARAILHQITGELTWEQFIAQAQADAVTTLGQIRDLLATYLGSQITGSGGGSGIETPIAEQTVSEILKAAGYSKSERENMSLIDSQQILGFAGSAWTDLLFPLGFKMETTLAEFFKTVFNTSQFDYTLTEIGTKLQEMVNAIPAMASGGYVPARPGGTIVRLGEGGLDEAVIPIRKSETKLGSRSGDISIVVNVTAHGDVNAKKLADQLENELVERFRYGRLNSAIKGVR